MPPDTYPTKVTWRFRNVTQAFDFYPTLPSIGINQANPQDIATMSGIVVGQGLDLHEEDKVWCKIDDEYVFNGHIKNVLRDLTSEHGEPQIGFDAQDITAKLDDSVIDHEKARGSESVAARVAWILSFLNYPITTANVNLPSEDMEKSEYGGMTVREALDQVADELRLSYYVDFEDDLHMFRVETITAPFELDDTVDGPDYATSFPYWGWSDGRDSVELANAIYVQGEKGQTWVTDGTSIATYQRQERSINDSELVTATQRTRAGERALAENKDPQVSGSLTLYEPGLKGGMSFHLTEEEHSIDATFLIVSLTISAVDPTDDDDLAYCHIELEYSDRRRARPYRNRRTPADSGQLVDGDAIAIDRFCLSANRNRIQAYGGGTPAPLADTVAYSGPVPPAHNEVVSMAPSYRRSYLASPGCGPGFQAAHSGWLTEEQWLELDVGDLDDVVSIRITFDVDQPNWVDGKDLVYGMIPASEGPPTHEYQYEVLGHVAIEDGATFDISANQFTPNVTNYVVIAPGWTAVWGVECCDAALVNGLEGPLGGIGPGGGEFNSGSIQIDSPAAVTRVFSGKGMRPWGAISGDIDGSNRSFGLPDWNGKGVPEVRIGGVVLAYGSDYDYDVDAAEVILAAAPWVGAQLEGRYRT